MCSSHTPKPRWRWTPSQPLCVIPPTDWANMEQIVPCLQIAVQKTWFFTFRGAGSLLEMLHCFGVFGDDGRHTQREKHQPCPRASICLCGNSCVKFEDNTLKMPQLVKSLFTLSTKSKKDSQSKDRTHGQGRAGAYSALAWFRQRRHMAGRQWEDKMFQTQDPISPEPGAALSLSSRGGKGRRGRGQGRMGKIGKDGQRGETQNRDTHGYDMMLTIHIL